MADSLNLRDIQSLIKFAGYIRKFKSRTSEDIAKINHEIKLVLTWINEKVLFLHKQVENSEIQIKIARENLYRCQCSGYTDKNGNYHRPNCSVQEAILSKALTELRLRQEKLQIAQRWNAQLVQAANEYRKKETQFMKLVLDQTDRNLARLGILIGKYQKVHGPIFQKQYDNENVTGKFDRTQIPPTVLKTEGKHSTLYKMARIAFFEQSLDDKNVPNYIKGWIKQELNRYKKTGYLRSHPGFDVGHKKPGFDDPTNFRWENSDMNRWRGAKEKNYWRDHE